MKKRRLRRRSLFRGGQIEKIACDFFDLPAPENIFPPLAAVTM
jgi:hypothetical protein